MLRLNCDCKPIPLLNLISTILEVDETQVNRALMQKDLLLKVMEFLAFGGHLTTAHLRNNKVLHFQSFCLRGAAHKRIYGNVTVESHMFTRHGIVLAYPDMPLLVSRVNEKCTEYFPLELLNYSRHRPVYGHQ